MKPTDGGDPMDEIEKRLRERKANVERISAENEARTKSAGEQRAVDEARVKTAQQRVTKLSQIRSYNEEILKWGRTGNAAAAAGAALKLAPLVKSLLEDFRANPLLRDWLAGK